MKIDATERDLCVGNAGDRAWKINFQGFPGRRPVVGGDLGNGRAFCRCSLFPAACVSRQKEGEREEAVQEKVKEEREARLREEEEEKKKEEEEKEKKKEDEEEGRVYLSATICERARITSRCA